MGSKGRSGNLRLNFWGGISISSFLLASADPYQSFGFPMAGLQNPCVQAWLTHEGGHKRSRSLGVQNTSCTELPAAFLGPKFPARGEIGKAKAAKPILCPSRQAALTNMSKRWKTARFPVSKT